MRNYLAWLIFPCLLAGIAFVISTVTEHWIDLKIGPPTHTVTAQSGLWRACFSVTNITECMTIKPNADGKGLKQLIVINYVAIRALMLHSILGQGLVCLLCLLSLFKVIKQEYLGVMAVIGSCASLSALVALLMYTKSLSDMSDELLINPSPGWSYFIGWFGVLLGIGCSITSIVFRHLRKQQHNAATQFVSLDNAEY